MSALPAPSPAHDAAWSTVALALRRAALAVAQPSGPALFENLVREAAVGLGVAVVFIAVFEDTARTRMRTLAVWLDGKLLRNFDYPLAGSPCAQVVGREFRYVADDVQRTFPDGSLFGAKGMDAYAAYPLTDSVGAPLGLFVTMDRAPFADPVLAEAMLKIFASRVAAELERSASDEAVRAAALAVSSARGDGVFAELARALANTLQAEMAVIARYDADDPDAMHTLATVIDGVTVENVRYEIAKTPCCSVLGQRFRAYPSRLVEQFPEDPDLAGSGFESYAGHPLSALDGRPLGIVAVLMRRPLAHVERVESMLQIFALRAAAEIERLRAEEALRRSESSYRAMFESSEDAIFLHDWDSGAIVDANPKACATYGYTLQELRELPLEAIGTGEAPFTGADALRHFEQARLGHAERFEWRRRNKDGSLHWDDVVLKRAVIGGVPVVLGFSHDVTQRKDAEEALKLREEQYRAVFEASSDAFVLRDGALRVVEVNPAFLRMSGFTREHLDSPSGYPPDFPAEYIAERQHYVRRALAGEASHLETRLLRADRSVIDADVRVMPVRYRGQPHVLSVIRDITARKQAERALKLREEQYRAVFDGSSDALVLRDGDTRVVDCNRAFCSMYGYSREEAIGTAYGDLPLATQDIDERSALVRRALAGEEGQIETYALRKDGERFDVELRFVPIRHRGEPHALVMARDITERKRADEALKLREEQYRVIFEASSDAFILRDAQMRVVDVNPAFLQLTGFTREHLDSDTGYPQGFPPEHVAARHALVRRALGGEHVAVEMKLLRADGSAFDADVRVMPVRHRGAPHVLSIVRDITERKRAETELKLREEQYRAIFEAASDAFVLRDSQLRIVDTNPAFERLYGFTHEVLAGETGYPADFPPGYVESRREQHRRALGGEAIHLETTALRADGTSFDADMRVLPIAYRGEPHVLAVVRDITERKQAEAALKLREEQYRAIFDGSTDALALWSRDVRIVDVNKAFCELYGYRREDVVGGTFGHRLGPDEIAQRVQAIRRALDGDEMLLETSTVAGDGRRFVVELRYLPMLHRGEPHVLAVARDITERKRAEAALRASEEQYRAIFEASADALVLRDADFRVVDVNPAYTALTGYTRDEMIGVARVLTGSAEEESLRRAQHARALAGELQRFEVQATRKDGSRYDGEVRGMPVQHRGAPHVLYVARDITERRRAEAERAELEAQLRQAQKMEAIGQLTGGIAHDFNNILTSVIGYVVLATERATGHGDARLQRQLEQAHLAAQRARDLIAQMLTFARRQRGERKPLALGALVHQSVQLLRATLPSSIELDAVEHDNGEPACPPVQADAVQIEQVLFNLCINARDAVGAASGRIEVRLGVVDVPAGGAGGVGMHCASCRARVERGRWVQLSVADSGSGIAADVLERMFDPFYTTKPVGRGSGMGLAMVHGIVHDHGGHLRVDTAPGAGSTFRVLLRPAGGVADATGQPAPSRRDAAPVPLRGRVVLVEDETMVGEFMSELLDGWGLDVLLFRDPTEALAWLGDPTHEVHLLITDQTMPQLTGVELAQRVCRLRPQLPMLLYSGNAAELDLGTLRGCGVTKALRKPVDPDALRGVLRELLGAPAALL
jgi:PAS domain S-box-containing protein